MPVYNWSSTAAANGTADATINMAEGMAPAAVNDGVRALMAAEANAYKDGGGGLATGGNATTYTLTTNQVFDTLGHLSGNKVKVRFHVSNGASPTLNIDSLGSVALQVASGTAVGAGVIGGNSIWDVTYNSTIPAFLLSGVPAAIQASTVTSTSIAAAAVQYSNIQNVASNSLIGNPSSTTAQAPSAITIGAGLTVSGSTIKSAFPPASAFKNLSIKVASNTTVAVAADFVTTTDGTTYQTTALSGTIDLGTSGAVNALDTGTIAADSTYFIWAIAKSDGTTGGLASLSSTAPTMPSGYPFKARIGAVKTIHAAATLYGTWQLGRNSNFVVGLAQTTGGLPAAATGSTGDISVPTWSSVSLASLVPTTASEVILVLGPPQAGAGTVMAAPSSSYGAATNTTNPPPLMTISFAAAAGPAVKGTMTMETSQVVYWANNVTNATMHVYGWVDNI